MSDDFMAAFQALVERARPDASAPVFKALTVPDGRRAMRLERSFWTALEFIATEYRLSVGQVVAAIEQAHLNETNLTSAVRHTCIHALSEELEDARSWFSETSVQHLVNACPSPVFALSASRKLRYTNQAFLKYVRNNFVGADTKAPDASLRLQIDTPMEDLITRLQQSRNQPITVGFAIGLNERRVRGSINALLAPEWQHQTILGFVVS